MDILQKFFSEIYPEHEVTCYKIKKTI